MIKFLIDEDARLHFIEHKTNFSDDKKLKASDLARKYGKSIEQDASRPKNRKKT